ncbi:MAG: hypothetical protein P4L46_00545 [Fimbriimonas sp.]|nr:hypothetical protein [Fimbriimonas sp.]
MLASVDITPKTFVGGSATVVNGKVDLKGVAPSGGLTVTLATSNASAITVPGSVTIAAGSSSGSFSASSVQNPVEYKPTITATLQGASKLVSVTVNPVQTTSLSLNPTSIPGGSPSIGTVTVSDPAGPNGIRVKLASNSAHATVPAYATVAPGSTSSTFKISTVGIAKAETVVITASNGASTQTASLAMTSTTIASVSVQPTNVSGGSDCVGTVLLTGSAPAGGIVVSLLSGNASATVPATITIPSGSSSGQFAVTTSPVSAVTPLTLLATDQITTRTCILTVRLAQLSSLAVTPSPVVGGSATPVAGVVNLDGPAPTGGATVTLASSNQAAVTTPQSVTVPAGSKSVQFAVTTVQNSTPYGPTISATFGGITKSASLSVIPEQVTGLSLDPASITSGKMTSGTVSISQTAGPSGIKVHLTASGTDVVTPLEAVVQSGATSATFNIGTVPVKLSETLNVTAANGASTKSAALTLVPAKLSGITATPASLVGGNPSSITLTLDGPAPAGGLSVSLFADNQAVSAPATVTVPAGKTFVTFAVDTSGVSASTAVKLSATASSVTTSTVMTIKPASLASLKLSIRLVVGGSSTPVTGTILLNGQAPTGGVVLNLASSNPYAATVPATVTVPAGQRQIEFPITTLQTPVVYNMAVSANLGGASQSVTLVVDPETLVSTSLSPNSVNTAGTSSGTVTISQTAGPKGILVNLQSDKYSEVPSSVLIPSGSTSATFAVRAKAVTKTVISTITVTVGVQVKTAQLTIKR